MDEELVSLFPRVLESGREALLHVSFSRLTQRCKIVAEILILVKQHFLCTTSLSANERLGLELAMASLPLSSS